MKGGCDEKRKLRVKQLAHIKMLNCFCDKNRLYLCFETPKCRESDFYFLRIRNATRVMKK